MNQNEQQGAPPRKWRNRIVGHGEEDPTQLLANPKNWRIHPKTQQDALAGVLAEVGWVQDVIINQRTGFVVDGHARIAMAISAGERVPVVYVDLSEEEEAVILATFDPISAMAAKDEQIFNELVRGMDESFKALVTATEAEQSWPLPEAGEDDVPEAPVIPVSRTGDLWLMDKHRLLCGDSTDVNAVSKVFGPVRPKLMITDQPFGAQYDPGWRKRAGINNSNRMGKVRNDDRADWREVWTHFPGDVAYVWHGGLHASTVADSLIACGFEIRSQIVWAKPSLVMGRGHYHWQHECCYYAVRGTGHWNGDRKQSTLWHIENRNQDAETVHSTQKPVECMRRPIVNNSSPGQAIYEPFCGSGTTIIGCEKEARSALAIELESAYVDVAVTRWQNFAGKQAVLDADGRTFEEIACERKKEGA